MDTKEKTIAVAMSGGIDSSVTVSLLLEQGCHVFGITMLTYSGSEQSATDARIVAEKLGIQHYTINLKEIFNEKIVKPFCIEYIQGRTPNPCIRCNRLIKFRELIRFAKNHNAEFLATGHYVRIENGMLRKGIDQTKDQSYFLSWLTKDQLKQIITPLGNFTKKQIREKAADLKLHIKDKPESQEICFLPDENYGDFINNSGLAKTEHGAIVDISGRIVGEHDGLHNYTIGQRRGLKVALGKPQYVIKIIPEENKVVIGDNSRLFNKGVKASNPNWFVSPDNLIGQPLKAKIRYRQKEEPGKIISIDENQVSFVFDSSQRAITPGQQLVIYDEDIVLGGATIDEASHI